MRLRRALALAACGLLGHCGGGPAIPAEDLLLRVTAGGEEVVLGAAFPLTVERVWSKDLLPAAWNDRALAPLVLRLDRLERREDARRLEERRHYVGYAFSLADLSIAAPEFVARPKAGGEDRLVSAEPLRLRVRRALDPAAPGPPELPDLPGRDRGAWWPWLLLAAAVALLVAVLRRPRGPRALPGAQDPASLALARLRALREAGTYVELSSVLRAYLSARFAIRAEEMTTEEILAGPGDRARLGRILRGCDLVKFAGVAPAATEFSALLDSAEAFVREGVAS